MTEPYLVANSVIGPYLTSDAPPSNRICHVSSEDGVIEGTPMLCGKLYERGNFEGHAWFGLHEYLNRRWVNCAECAKLLG